MVFAISLFIRMFSHVLIWVQNTKSIDVSVKYPHICVNGYIFKKEDL